MAPVFASAATSAQDATKEFFSVPQAMPTPTPGCFFAKRVVKSNRFAASSSTARRRGLSRWARRNASGSVPAASANSSMKHSRANVLAVAARAR
jgi:hypothetical protein